MVFERFVYNCKAVRRTLAGLRHNDNHAVRERTGPVRFSELGVRSRPALRGAMVGERGAAGSGRLASAWGARPSSPPPPPSSLPPTRLQVCSLIKGVPYHAEPTLSSAQVLKWLGLALERRCAARFSAGLRYSLGSVPESS